MKKFVVCIDNSDYTVSLEKNKIYEVIPDKKSKKYNSYRIIDESGDLYYHPISRFVEIKIPKKIEKVLCEV
jgi:hypothetical protein